MHNHTRKSYLLHFTFIFVLFPCLLYVISGMEAGTALKSILSVTTLLAFSLMLGQMYLSGSNNFTVQILKMRMLSRLHIIVGYVCCLFLLAHPLFIVVPRFFEGGVSPVDALLLMLTTYSSKGVVLGIMAWGLVLFLVFMSFFRKMLPVAYNHWKKLHGVCAVVLTVLSTWHVIELGYHSAMVLSLFFLLLAAGGVSLLMNNYYFSRGKRGME